MACQRLASQRDGECLRDSHRLTPPVVVRGGRSQCHLTACHFIRSVHGACLKARRFSARSSAMVRLKVASRGGVAPANVLPVTYDEDSLVFNRIIWLAPMHSAALGVSESDDEARMRIHISGKARRVTSMDGAFDGRGGSQLAIRSAPSIGTRAAFYRPTDRPHLVAQHSSVSREVLGAIQIGVHTVDVPQLY
jgi:hypothetical protein